VTLILKLNSLRFEAFWIVAIALLVGLTLAANQNTQYALFGVLGTYLYWVFRVLIEAAFFVTALFATEKFLSHLLPTWASYAVATLLSLIPFTLAITALDIIVGLPEMGLNDDTAQPASRSSAFALELFYQLDNHILLGCLLLIPRVLLQISQPPEPSSEAEITTLNDGSVRLRFLDSLEPPLDGSVCCIEAQEHYILVTTSTESRLVLHRFSDAVKQMPSALGMQVHRSHWIAHEAVKGVIVEGQSMKLKLASDKEVPVSRTFRKVVESKFGQLCP
jgi:hypothetical protein